MYRLKTNIIVLLLMIYPFRICASVDTFQLLRRDAFVSIVRAYHPIVKSAGLQVRRAEAGVQQARGAFDPTVDATFASKTLDGKQYYRYFNPQLTIPTWYGIELIGGMEEAEGPRLSPEATSGQLSYAGAKLNLNGVLLDQRRAILRQAMSIRQQTEAERRIAVNQLLYDGLTAYFNWQRDRDLLNILNMALENARARAGFVRTEFDGGVRAAIDTVEAVAQLQAIDAQQVAARVAFMNAGLELSNFLWLESGVPFPIHAQILPEAFMPDNNLPSLEELLLQALSGHPKLHALRSKLDVLEIDRRLKATYLAPQLSVKGMVLSHAYGADSEVGSIPYLEQNSKIAAELSLPLFLRQARGAHRAAGFKLQETTLEIDQSGLEIQNKIRTSYNDVQALATQRRLTETMFRNYERLYNGERVKFEAGESTLFLLNSRQNKVIEVAQKLAELSAKYSKAEAALYFAAGLLQ